MRPLRWNSIAAGGVLALAVAGSAQGQRQPVSRAEAIAAALSRAPRLALARADSSAAGTLLALARQFENPTFAAGYSKSSPQQHLSMDIPLDLPWLRRPRVMASAAGLGAAIRRYRFERAAIAFVIDTAYTRALASARMAALSRQTTRDADSLVTLAGVRRDAGDGTELDVQLAIMNAGQLANLAARDSLDAELALWSLQEEMGLRGDSATIVLSDTAATAVGDVAADSGTLLLVAAAEEDLRAAESSLTAARRRVFAAPALSVGFDASDPSGAEPGVLPMVGVSLPLPLFNRNSASVALAVVDRDRARAALALARLDGTAQSARARRELTLARERVARSERLLDSANRVSVLSLLAYREGASTLPNVLASQRSAREALAQYVVDVASLHNAAALVRLLSSTVNPSNQ